MIKFKKYPRDLKERALEYHERGFSLLPVIGKRPSIPSWKRQQSSPPDPALIRLWFNNPDVTGIALITGKVSGGLAIRDFDSQESYRAWSEKNPRLSTELPTVMTPRGFHVYHKSDQSGFVSLPDGEFRGDSWHYTVAPPSLHPEGLLYRWTIPLGDTIPFVESSVFGLTSTHFQQEKVRRGVCRVFTSNGCGCDFDAHARKREAERNTQAMTPDEVIRFTLPARKHERNRSLARLAQGLKHNCGLSFSEMKTWVREWHRLALPFIETRDFDLTWKEFSYWALSCAHPLAVNPVYRINVEIDPVNSPISVQHALDKYRGLACVPEVIRLCFGLADREGRFFLSGSDAARKVGTTDKSVWRIIRALVDDGLLLIETTGDRHRATRYRIIK